MKRNAVAGRFLQILTTKVSNNRIYFGMEDSTKKSTKVKSEPKIFGEDVIGHSKDSWHDKHEYGDGDDYKSRFHFHHHNHHHGSLTWGLAFILIGLLFLFSNFGALPPVVWSQVAHLWPILIILIGFDTLLGHSEVADLINSLVALFIFTTILGLVFLNYSPNLLHGLPQSIMSYLGTINHYIHLK